MRRAALLRALQSVPAFDAPDPRLEQIVTPAERAADLLELALAAGDLAGRSVLDLGCGTGRLAIGAALVGAAPVAGIDRDARAIAVARTAADRLGASVDFAVGSADDAGPPVDTVVMNPPFGAQRRHADRPFWDTALARAGRAVYAFALADSRTFIAQRTVERGAHIVRSEPVAWELERSFPHHTHRRVAIAVDLWAIRTDGNR